MDFECLKKIETESIRLLVYFKNIKNTAFFFFSNEKLHVGLDLFNFVYSEGA